MKKLTMYWIKRSLNCIKHFKTVLFNPHFLYICGLSLAILFLYIDNKETDHETQVKPSVNWKQSGDILFHRKTNLRIHHSDYAKSVIYKLAIKVAEENEITICRNYSSAVFDRVDMHRRQAEIFHSIGDSNLHIVSAYIDDRLSSDDKLLRVLAAGLYPFPKGKPLFCNYMCRDQMCSSHLTGVVILAGNVSDYPEDNNAKSLMDALYMTCPIKTEHTSLQISITRSPCAFSHNFLGVQRLDSDDIVQPPWDFGICVLPYDLSKLQEGELVSMTMWVEYLRLQGAGGLHLYLYNTTENPTLESILKFYKQESLRIVHWEDWSILGKRLEKITSSELAKNHCVYKNMRKYKYIFVLPFQMWFHVSSEFRNIKQFVRSSYVSSITRRHGGVRIPGAIHGMLVKPKLVLLTAAGHFVSLTGQPSYRILAKDTLSLVTHDEYQQVPTNFATMTTVNRSISLKNILNSKIFRDIL